MHRGLGRTGAGACLASRLQACIDSAGWSGMVRSVMDAGTKAAFLDSVSAGMLKFLRMQHLESCPWDRIAVYLSSVCERNGAAVDQ